MQGTSKNLGMSGEQFPQQEAPQNYGFTSVVHAADKDKDGNITGSAHGFMNFPGGNRSMGYVGVMDDRRHRLKELDKGDTAFYRGKDDKQQFHMHEKGTYLTTRDDKVFRAALVAKAQDDQQQQPQGRGGGGAQGGAGGGKDDKDEAGNKKPQGQKSARDDNMKSQVAIEQNGTTTYSQYGEAYGSQKGGSDSTVHWGKDKKKSAQSTEMHTHIRFGEHRIYNDKDGNFWTIPCLVKKDEHCKEG